MFYLTGGSGSRDSGSPLKKHARKDELPSKKKQVAHRTKKGKETRPNYLTMNPVDYAQIRQSNWYRNVPRDENIEDPNFWCMEQIYIYKDIYLHYTHPIRPMQPYRLRDIKAKASYAQAADVIEQMGMVPLIEKQCPYNVPLILQFFSTLVIETDHIKTMKWMTGRTQCTSSFARLSTLLGYAPYQSNLPPNGYTMHTVQKFNKNIMKDMYGAGAIIGEKGPPAPL